MRSVQRQRGIVAVEFAILLIPLLVMLMGITEFGRAMYYYDTIAKSARDATRLMSTRTPADSDYATLWGNAQCDVVYGNPGCTGNPLVPGLTTAMVSLCDPVACPATHQAVGASPPVNLVTVTVSGYTFQSLAVYVASFGFAPISVTMRQI